MRLFKKHNGKQGVAVRNVPEGLDVAASLDGNRLYLHVINLNYRGSVEAVFSVPGMNITGGRVFEIAPQSPRQAVTENDPAVFAPTERQIPKGYGGSADLQAGQPLSWRFPATSVSAVELTLASAG